MATYTIYNNVTNKVYKGNFLSVPMWGYENDDFYKTVVYNSYREAYNRKRYLARVFGYNDLKIVENG